MRGFGDRRIGIESVCRLDEELAFRIAARRDRLFGYWAAGRMGLSGTAAETYAGTVVAADLSEPDDQDVIERVQADLAAKGIACTEIELRTALNHAAVMARSQITNA